MDRSVLMMDEFLPGTEFDWQILARFPCCWISLFEIDLAAKEEKIPPVFQHEHLNILFRSASSVSAQNYLSGPVGEEGDVLPPGFSFRLFRVHVGFVTQDDLLIEKSNFLGKNYWDRLLVIVMKRLPPIFDFTLLKRTWNASEVIHCSNYSEVASISGTEFQSVIVFAQLGLRGDFLQAISMAASRAHFEVVILIIRAKVSSSDVPRELMIRTMGDFAMFYQLISSIPGNVVRTRQVHARKMTITRVIKKKTRSAWISSSLTKSCTPKLRTRSDTNPSPLSSFAGDADPDLSRRKSLPFLPSNTGNFNG